MAIVAIVELTEEEIEAILSWFRHLKNEYIVPDIDWKLKEKPENYLEELKEDQGR